MRLIGPISPIQEQRPQIREGIDAPIRLQPVLATGFQLLAPILLTVY
jgi:hypothetical protein